MDNADSRQHTVLQDRAEPLPGDGTALTTPVEPLVQQAARRHHVATQRPVSDLVDYVSTLLIHGSQDRDSSADKRRYHACRKAISLIHRQTEPIQVTELAAAAGVSRRVLERGFQETIGVSPHQYMKACRLNQLHRKLRSERSPAVTVTDLSTSLGFTEQGRMAAEYRRMFGELPSATLTGDHHLHGLRLADALAEKPHVAS